MRLERKAAGVSAGSVQRDALEWVALTMASQTQYDEAEEELQSAEDEENEFNHVDVVGSSKGREFWSCLLLYVGCETPSIRQLPGRKFVLGMCFVW